MAGVYELADEYVDRLAALDPVLATAIGISGHDAQMLTTRPKGLGPAMH